MPQPLVLLIDDAPELGNILGYVGKRAGIEIASCLDATAAWEFLHARRPDLVLLDVNLPGVSGPQLCRRIRATPAFAALCVALFTHWGLPGDIAAGLEAGADFVVSKDLVGRPLELQQRLEEILAAEDSQPARERVGWNQGPKSDPIRPDWLDRVNHAIRVSALRLMGSEVMRIVLRRALLTTQTPPPLNAAVAPWISSEGLILRTPALVTALDTQAVIELIVSLMEQSGRLLGAEASRPFREALAGVVPGWSGEPSH